MKIVATLLLLMAPSLAMAHGTGFTFEKQIGEYFVDIGYDVEAPLAGQPVRFDFALTRSDATGYPEDVAFTSAWVRIAEGNRTVFATGIASPEFGRPTLVYAFPEGGSYVVSVRYERGGEELAEAEMPLDVRPVSEPLFGVTRLLFGLAGLAVGAIGTLVLRRRRTAA